MTISSPDHVEAIRQVTPNSASITTAEKRVLARIFHHPLSHNLSWRETLALLHAIGEVEHRHNGDVVMKLGNERQIFTPARHQDLETDDVMALRHFLLRAGWAPRETPAPEPASATTDIVIVVDHAGARVYAAGPEEGDTPHELHHLLHYMDRAKHDADREETNPTDALFFDAIAAAVPAEGQIVVIGHGKGQSSEADHLMAYLSDHQSAIHARVVREILADLPHTTAPELIELARHALQPRTTTAE